MANISVNIVCMDHYMHSPKKELDVFVSEFRASTIAKVPIIRIFGSTYEGIKACVHIHGVFPYFYVPCDNSTNNPMACAYQLAAALDKAINTTLNQATSTQQHVHNVTLEHGIPFYGYHSEEQQFFKIAFYNPLLIKKASALLQSGNILGSVYQPYECHIPYKLQFMIDFNLFGMNFVRFSKPQHRDDKIHKKQSVCPIEFDVLANDILNQYEIIPGNVACNPGIQYIRDEEQKRNGKPKVFESSDLTQNRINIEPTASDITFRNKLEALLKKNVKKSEKTSQNGSPNITMTTSLADITILDNTQLEEHAQLLLNLLSANAKAEAEEDEGIDENCILSQKITKSDDELEDGNGENDLNMSLLDCVLNTSIDLNDFKEL